MPPIFEYHYTVAEADIDVQGHANNVCYVDWMQSAALAHSAAQGWPTQRYLESGTGWVARMHRIDYRLPSFAGDRIVVRTWVATMTKVTSIRRYRILRPADGALLATAETKWAFLDFTTGQPMRIPTEVIDAFQLVDDPDAGGLEGSI